MKILFYFVTLIVLVNTKEKLSGLEQYFQDPRFWQFVEKRLDSKNEVKSKVSDVPDESPSKPKDQYVPINTHSESDNSEENVQSDKHQADLMEDTLGNLCQYRPNASLIIRSKASINNGAFFLKSFNKKTREECVNACCYTQGCNLIVYENKAEHSCYLFNCGTPSKCLFAEHANYTSMFFPNHVAPSSSSTGHQQQHENELEGLNSKETPKPTTNAPRKNVPLYGRCDIDWNEECSDRNAECRDGICKCSYGYHAKYGICRVDCPDSAFECENKGQGFNVPECISNDHVCDGQPQCADGSDEETCAPPPSATTTTTTITTTTTTSKPTTLKAVQQILSRQGVNDQILPQYFPSNVNRLPVGSDTSMYNGNAYYWPSGYNPLYGTQNVPQTYGRFQPGVQYPYDPRFYNSYDSNGRLISTNNGYINPVQDYYGKSATGSKSHAPSSQTDLGTGNPKGSKPYSGERYFNRKVAPVPQGRDGAPVLSKQVASGQDHILKSTSMPTTVHSPLQSVSTKGSSNKWKSQNQQTDWNQPEQTGWKSSSIKNSKNHFRNDVPSWKSDDKTQDLAPDSQNEWEKTPNSAHDKMDQKNNKLEPNESEQQTSSDSMSSPHSDKNSQLETGNQEVPVPHRDAAPERTWKQHTESNMGNPNLGSETNMQKNAEGAGKGRIHEDSRVQGNTDSAESQGRKSTINQDGGQSGKLNELQGWTESTNRGNGQTGTNHKQQNSMASGIQTQGRSRGRSKGRISGAYHRKQGIKDRNQMTDNSGKLHKQKQKEVQQNTDYDNYLNKNPLSGQRKTSGHRRPLHRYDGSRYPFYDSPYSYWNYDYYNYDDNPSKKYPSPVNQENTDYKDSMVDEEGKNVPYVTTPKPTQKPSPRPRPTTPAKTTQAPDRSANKDKDPDQETSITEKDPDLQTADNKPAQPSPKTDKTLTPISKNSTAQNVPDSSGLGGEVVESHVVVESPTDSHQGPIVALGLGLGITVILLFFVGCRLRNVKRRIRKGRALHSNEADYLINGMYL